MSMLSKDNSGMRLQIPEVLTGTLLLDDFANVSVDPARVRFPSDSANASPRVIHLARKWNLLS